MTHTCSIPIRSSRSSTPPGEGGDRSVCSSEWKESSLSVLQIICCGYVSRWKAGLLPVGSSLAFRIRAECAHRLRWWHLLCLLHTVQRVSDVVEIAAQRIQCSAGVGCSDAPPDLDARPDTACWRVYRARLPRCGQYRPNRGGRLVRRNLIAWCAASGAGRVAAQQNRRCARRAR